MTILIIIAAMLIVGLIVGWVAGLIWKDNRPMGVQGDYLVAIIAAIATGLMDWYIIPAMGVKSAINSNIAISSIYLKMNITRKLPP